MYNDYVFGICSEIFVFNIFVVVSSAHRMPTCFIRKELCIFNPRESSLKVWNVQTWATNRDMYVLICVMLRRHVCLFS